MKKDGKHDCARANFSHFIGTHTYSSGLTVLSPTVFTNASLIPNRGGDTYIAETLYPPSAAMFANDAVDHLLGTDGNTRITSVSRVSGGRKSQHASSHDWIAYLIAPCVFGTMMWACDECARLIRRRQATHIKTVNKRYKAQHRVKFTNASHLQNKRICKCQCGHQAVFTNASLFASRSGCSYAAPSGDSLHGDPPAS